MKHRQRRDKHYHISGIRFKVLLVTPLISQWSSASGTDYILSQEPSPSPSDSDSVMATATDRSSIISQEIASQINPDSFLEIEQELSVLETYSGPQQLHFKCSPQASGAPSSYIRPQNILIPNSGDFPLTSNRQTNRAFLLVETRLCALLEHTRNMDVTERQERLRARIEHNIDILHSYKELEWESQRSGEHRMSLRINSGQSVS